MIKLKSILNESILISRRSRDERLKFHRAHCYKKIKRYIKNGCQGSLHLFRTPIEYLPDELKYVDGDLDLVGTPIKKLPDGLKVKCTLWLGETLIEEYPSNIEVGYSITLDDTKIKSLPDNISIYGNLYISNTEISEIPNNLNIRYTMFCANTPLLKKYTTEQIKQMIISKGGSVINVSNICYKI